MIHSYPQVFQLGHRCVEGIFDGPVVLQEKVDGSQLSFGTIDGALQVRSKGQQIVLGGPAGMFDKAIETITALEPLLTPGFVYRGEYLSKPHHNALVYTRVPAKYIILYDISGNGDEVYMPYDKVCAEAARLGLEVVPQFFEGVITDRAMFNELLERDSVLGGTKIEGVVAKNYNRFGQDKKCLMAKYVRTDMREMNADAQKRLAPKGGDIITQLIETYRVPARWQKAVQHLRERGDLQQAPQDIGPLMKEVQADVLKEEEDAIKAVLFKWAWPQIARAISHGLPDWYKEELAKQAFPGDEPR